MRIVGQRSCSDNDLGRARLVTLRHIKPVGVVLHVQGIDSPPRVVTLAPSTPGSAAASARAPAGHSP
ncbi:hypothetical protein ADL03_37340 [Nocardia sp. NRRL S-836]|nr:hypothetical protein ADL03_37340 [Nocardia sp. NRRL S-836]